MTNSAEVHLETSFVYNNSANSGGGFVLAEASSLTMISSSLQNNTSSFTGGVAAVFADAELHVLNCTAYSNYAELGAFSFSTESTVQTIDASSFYHNLAERGGVVFGSAESQISINDCDFKGNHAAIGGVLYLLNKQVNVSRSNFTYNTALSEDGGAIYMSFVRNFNVDHCSFERNSATKSGQIYIADTSRAVITSCKCLDGIANIGGCIGVDGSSNVEMRDNQISNNRAALVGGGISIATGSVLNISNSVIENNTAVAGGGIQVQGTLIADSVTIQNNAAQKLGGGILIKGGVTSNILNAVHCINNTAHLGGGMVLGYDSCSVLSRDCVFE